MRPLLLLPLFSMLISSLLFSIHAASSPHDYHDALAKSILFFEAQRSGRLPPDQRANWRGDSAVDDGSEAGVDLEGGYYDAGDNVKFHFPMAFTATMLAWSVVEFGDSMPPDELRNAAAAIRWATDYLLKTISDSPSPAAFSSSDDPGLRAGVCPFYCDFNGYQDELLWGAAWLRSNDSTLFLNYIQTNGKTLGADDNTNEFGWDNKHAGINVLLSREFLHGQLLSLQSYKHSADSFMCTLIPESSSSHIQYTPGGLI